MTGAAVAMPTVGEAVRAAAARLAAAGVPEPDADAAVLAAHALGATRIGLVLAAREPLDAGTAARLARLVARRAAREPVQHLTGVREFWSLDFAVDRRVLVPRPETERLVETALRVAPGARRVLDIGTGSGCIAVVLARELPAAAVVASDLSADALAVARANRARHAPRVALVRADLACAFRDGAFDLVVANPPYVSDADMVRLASEVREHEPRAALAGGADGLAVIRRLVADAGRVLARGGWLVFEVGSGQADAAAALVAARPEWGPSEVVRDLADIARVLAVPRRGDAEGRRTAWTRS